MASSLQTPKHESPALATSQSRSSLGLSETDEHAGVSPDLSGTVPAKANDGVVAQSTSLTGANESSHNSGGLLETPDPPPSVKVGTSSQWTWYRFGTKKKANSNVSSEVIFPASPEVGLIITQAEEPIVPSTISSEPIEVSEIIPRPHSVSLSEPRDAHKQSHEFLEDTKSSSSRADDPDSGVPTPRKGSTANGRSSEDTQVRINIIVDPDSGETVGTVALRNNSLKVVSFEDDEPDSSQQVSPVTTCSIRTEKDECQYSTEDSNVDLQESRSRCPLDAQVEASPQGNAAEHETRTQASEEQRRAEKAELMESNINQSDIRSLYSGITPSEANEERGRIEKWIEWATRNKKDTSTWQKRRNRLKQKASRRRIFKRRVVVFGQRIKDLFLFREGNHSTHASFEQQKAHRPTRQWRTLSF